MTEKLPAPAPEEWRRLYEAAMRVRELAPWEWMAEVALNSSRHAG